VLPLLPLIRRSRWTSVVRELRDVFQKITVALNESEPAQFMWEITKASTPVLIFLLSHRELENLLKQRL